MALTCLIDTSVWNRLNREHAHPTATPTPAARAGQYDRPLPAADDDIETRLAVVERDVAQLREQLALTITDAAAGYRAPGLQPRTSGRVEQCSPPGKRVISE